VKKAQRPTALTLNILVASVGTFRWIRAGLVDWKTALPLLLMSIPASFIGGSLELPGAWYRLLVSAILVLAAYQMLFPRSAVEADGPARIPWQSGTLAGATIGLLSGLTGTGGGIFLSPLLLALGWAGPRQSFREQRTLQSHQLCGGFVREYPGAPELAIRAALLVCRRTHRCHGWHPDRTQACVDKHPTATTGGCTPGGRGQVQL
jgi:hypothetical protein